MNIFRFGVPPPDVNVYLRVVLAFLTVVVAEVADCDDGGNGGRPISFRIVCVDWWVRILGLFLSSFRLCIRADAKRTLRSLLVL